MFRVSDSSHHLEIFKGYVSLYDILNNRRNKRVSSYYIMLNKVHK